MPSPVPWGETLPHQFMRSSCVVHRVRPSSIHFYAGVPNLNTRLYSQQALLMQIHTVNTLTLSGEDKASKNIIGKYLLFEVTMKIITGLKCHPYIAVQCFSYSSILTLYVLPQKSLTTLYWSQLPC